MIESTIEPLFVADDEVPAAGESGPSRRRWAIAALTTATVLSTAMGGAGLAYGHAAQQSAHASSRALQGFDTRLQALEGASPASAAELRLLSDKQKASETAVAVLGTDLETVSAGAQGLGARLAKAEARLKPICDRTAVSNQDAAINGQWTATDNTNYTYYSNLTAILQAVCGAPTSRERTE